MAVPEHEEMLRIVEEAFLIDVAMMAVVEAGIDGLNEPADDLLEGFQRAVDLGFGDGVVFGVDDDRAHGEASGERVRDEPGARSLSAPRSPLSGLPLALLVRPGAG